MTVSTPPPAFDSIPISTSLPPNPSGYDFSQLYINRELSWLEFNARVLSEAEDPSVPLFERLKFLAIFGSNLDEFFMVRVAGLKQQAVGAVVELPPDGATPSEQLAMIHERGHQLTDRAYRIWREQLRPALEQEGIVLLSMDELSEAQLGRLDKKFREDIFPVLTPITIDPNHPFPHLKNKSINLGVMFTHEHKGDEVAFGVVQVPIVLDRFMLIKHESARWAYVLLEDVIRRHVHDIFPAYRLRGSYAFRVTRNFDLEIDEEEGEDLMQTIQQELRRRDRGNAVRVEISGESTGGSVNRLCRALRLHPREDVYMVDGPLNLSDLTSLVSKEERRDLRDEAWSPQMVPPLRDTPDVFADIRENDILLHHPYESFDAVIDFVAAAADDPNVLAIKQTLYRAGGDSPIVRALARAAENGKQVTAIVELKARFDEDTNIKWASTLETAGVHVIYGLRGLKTHAKALLVVRREKDKLRRYVHLSTGNYNQTTSRLYTDLGLFTARDDIGEDVTSLFNLLTSYSAPATWNSLVVAPLGLHEAVLHLIAREAEHARQGRPASMVAKMNACVDRDVIEALYDAAKAGVQIDLLIRGICCLRPGIPGISENIRVTATVDRFLEHARAFWFNNGGKEEVYLSSADWMPRNFHRRVEVLIPILDPAIQERITKETLGMMLQSNLKTWRLTSEGSYERVEIVPNAPLLRAQTRFMELAREKVREAESNVRVNSRIQLRKFNKNQPFDSQRPRKKKRANNNNDDSKD
jgi:polyphosphate kinase